MPAGFAAGCGAVSAFGPACRLQGAKARGCPVPAEEAPAVVDLEQKQEAFRFDMARVRDGIVYAEILSPPKALRRGRI